MRSPKMKWAIIIVLIIVALFIVLRVVNPVLMVLTKSPMPKVEAQLSASPGKIVCELTLRQTEKNFYVISFSGDRTSMERIGLQPPVGFSVAPFEESGPSAELSKKLNAEELRFAGRLLLKPGEPVQVIFPATATEFPALEISGMYESAQTFMKMTSGFHAKYKPAGEQATTGNDGKAPLPSAESEARRP